jgi:hypothetical protein
MYAKTRMQVGKTVVSWGGYPYHPVNGNELTACNDQTYRFGVVEGDKKPGIATPEPVDTTILSA